MSSRERTRGRGTTVTKSADPDSKDYAGRTPLVLAATNGHRIVVECLETLKRTS
ncbi:hypothetical protein BDW72DRAFT_187961 [Aspergillus terricola var. indicus]